MKVFRLILALLLAAAPLSAQQVSGRFPARDTARAIHAWTTMRVAKWSTLTISTAAVVYGFAQNHSADRAYADIERLCVATPDACARTTENGPYSDAALEARYQSVVRQDSHAHTALVAGQIGVVASALLFILDLPKSTTPEDIPYQPRPFRFDVGGGRLRFSYGITTR